jgi:hypothetical protein
MQLPANKYNMIGAGLKPALYSRNDAKNYLTNFTDRRLEGKLFVCQIEAPKAEHRAEAVC